MTAVYLPSFGSEHAELARMAPDSQTARAHQEAAVEVLWDASPRCSCGNEATCVIDVDGGASACGEDYACDDCCSHGGESGCVMLEEDEEMGGHELDADTEPLHRSLIDDLLAQAEQIEDTTPQLLDAAHQAVAELRDAGRQNMPYSLMFYPDHCLDLFNRLGRGPTEDEAATMDRLVSLGLLEQS